MVVVPIFTNPAPVAVPYTGAPTTNDPDLATEIKSFSIDATHPEAPGSNAPERPAVPPNNDANSPRPKVRVLASNITGVSSTRPLVRRDSLERREALLKGGEGSRQRRRWENDRLLSNPWAVPPLPSDWEVRPTYPRRSVPYYLAPLWDAAEFQRAVESKMKGRKNSTRARGKKNAVMSPMEEAATNIPREVKAKLKRAKAAKGLLQDLEEDIRAFVQRWNQRELRLREEGLHDVSIMSEGEDDEEIVFIGRNGVMHDSPERRQQELDEGWDGETSGQKKVFEGLDGDKGASFARWLVHCVGAYYGLRTWSVTREIDGQERKREAYVAVDTRARGSKGRGMEFGREIELPRPLWGMV